MNIKPIPALLIGLVILFAVSSCKKLYMPDLAATNKSLLVVEGFINISDSTFVKLSKTVGLASSANDPELNAAVSIENGKGISYKLTEKGKGSYTAPSLNLSATEQYRLKIITKSGKVYVSDLVDAKVSPVIDSVSTLIKAEGLDISVNTHDTQNNTRYYRWEYTETWEFNTFFISEYYYNGTDVVPRPYFVNHCWGNHASSVILLANTVKLDKDVVFKAPITAVPSTSEKLTQRYSIIVVQYPLTKSGYEYYQQLKTNTEDLGSIFDAMPASTFGNLHNTGDPGEKVIGFISAGSVSKKRIFISEAQLPVSYRLDHMYNTPYNQYTCLVGMIERSEYEKLFGGKAPFYTPLKPGTGVRLHECADCTLRGTITKPSFW